MMMIFGSELFVYQRLDIPGREERQGFDSHVLEAVQVAGPGSGGWFNGSKAWSPDGALKFC